MIAFALSLADEEAVAQSNVAANLKTALLDRMPSLLDAAEELRPRVVDPAQTGKATRKADPLGE